MSVSPGPNSAGNWLISPKLYDIMRFILLIIAQIVPWYLFPGAAPKDTSKVPVPAAVEETVPALTVPQDPAPETAIPDTTAYVLDIPDVINITLALPFGAGDNGSVDFYCGALMAARDLGDSGVKLNLNVLNTVSNQIGAGTFYTSDVIIGPISSSDLQKALVYCPEGKSVISPLDHKADSLVAFSRLVQTPTSADEQLRDLAAWAAEGLAFNENIVVVAENGEDRSSDIITNELDRLGVPYSKVYGYQALDACVRQGMHTKFITGSDKDIFEAGLVRSVSVLSLQKQSVSLYCPSKVKSVENLNVELIHNADTHFCTAYHIDYGSREVKDFVLAYRALFKTEPNSYSFHGYDTFRYFAGICAKYGRDWFKKLEEYREEGLQTSFDFVSEGCGAVNLASRRIVYSPDYSITQQ